MDSYGFQHSLFAHAKELVFLPGVIERVSGEVEAQTLFFFAQEFLVRSACCTVPTMTSEVDSTVHARGSYRYKIKVLNKITLPC